MSPRVIHVVPAVFGREGGVLGGAERYAFELARHMANRTPTTLISFGPRSETWKAGNLDIEIIGNPWYVRGQRGNPVSLRLPARLRHADVVHCHQHHVTATSLAALFCRLSGKRVVVTDEGGGGWDISGYVSTDGWFHALLHLSEYSRRIYGHEGRASARVIYGGVDTVMFSPEEPAVRGSTVIFVGRLLPHKGVNDLIAALPGGMQLDLIGPAPDARYLQDLESLARGKAVRFRHNVSDAELVQAYRRSLCVVLPSVYDDMYGGRSLVPELLGQTLLEGMACGIPAVCTDVASMPEIVVDGVTGFVVPPNTPQALEERLLWLHENPEQTCRMGEAARRHVLEKFTWPLVVDRCLEAYAG